VNGYDADEVGPRGWLGAALIFEPIGVDQPRRIVVGMLADGFQKRTLVLRDREISFVRAFSDGEVGFGQWVHGRCPPG
jgi:hypothetical protein